MIWENGIKTCVVSYKKRIASPGSMQDTGCLGKNDDLEHQLHILLKFSKDQYLQGRNTNQQVEMGLEVGYSINICCM